MAELADAADSKSAGDHSPWGFDSLLRDHFPLAPRVLRQLTHLRTIASREPVKLMSLLQIVTVLIVMGVLLWLVNRNVPMQGTIKSILNGVVVIAVVLC